MTSWAFSLWSAPVNSLYAYIISIGSAIFTEFTDASMPPQMMLA